MDYKQLIKPAQYTALCATLALGGCRAHIFGLQFGDRDDTRIEEKVKDTRQSTPTNDRSDVREPARRETIEGVVESYARRMRIEQAGIYTSSGRLHETIQLRTEDGLRTVERCPQDNIAGNYLRGERVKAVVVGDVAIEIERAP